MPTLRPLNTSTEHPEIVLVSQPGYDVVMIAKLPEGSQIELGFIDDLGIFQLSSIHPRDIELLKPYLALAGSFMKVVA